MARPTALAAAIAVSLLAVSGAGAGEAQQAPKRGGTLVFRMIGAEPACLNIMNATCRLSPTLALIVNLILARPFEVGPDFTYRQKLATATFTRRPPFTVTYRIRSDAKWSDGKPITAQDFDFTLRAMRRHGSSDVQELHRVVRRIHILDRKRVRLVLRPRSSRWRELFGNVLPQHALRGADLTNVWTTTIDDPRTGQSLGSGPFLVERYDRGRQLVLRRNPRYWDAHASYLDRIVVVFGPPASDPTDALRAAEIDIAERVPPDRVADLRRQPGIRVSVTQASTFEHLDLRLAGGNPALGRKLVRRALAYGIDRGGLVREVYGAIGPTLRPLDSAVLLARSPYYVATWGSYRYRPNRARELLQQAGCLAGDDGIYSCAGERLSLRFVTTAGVTARARALSLLQEQLRRAGVEVVPVFVPGSAFFAQILPGGMFDAALFSWIANPGESWSEEYGCEQQTNYTGYCQRLVTAAFDQAERILDAEQQARVLNRADAQLARDVPTIPLYQIVATAARSADVRNYVLHPTDPFWNAENWWLAK